MSTTTELLKQPTAYQNLAQPRILVVEDEANLLEAIKMNLELEGYEVVAAITGPMALKKFSEERFNLVVLDIMLPELMATRSARPSGLPTVKRRSYF